MLPLAGGGQIELGLTQDDLAGLEAGEQGPAAARSKAGPTIEPDEVLSGIDGPRPRYPATQPPENPAPSPWGSRRFGISACLRTGCLVSGR
jgi:hypothetical protein